MNRIPTICTLLCVVVLRSVPASGQDDFRPATFRGLTIGKAKIADVMKQLGPPVQRWDDKRGTVWMYYKDIGPVSGKVEITVNKKTQFVDYVAVYPDNVTLDAAKELFGSGYRTIRSAFDTCLD